MYRNAQAFNDFDVSAHDKSHAFHDRPGKVTTTVTECESIKSAAGFWVCLRRHRALQMRQHHESLATGLDAGGFHAHQIVRVQSARFTDSHIWSGEFIAEPAHHNPAAGERMQHVKSGYAVIMARHLILWIQNWFIDCRTDRKRRARVFAEDAGLDVSNADRSAGLVQCAGACDRIWAESQFTSDFGSYLADDFA